MHWFERRVVEALCTVDDPTRRAAIIDWVDSSLRAMPELLRAGVGTGSVVLGAWDRVTRREGEALVEALATSPFPPVRQHLRLLRSLVLFGDLELGGGPTT